MTMQNHRRVIALDAANTKVQELAHRLMDGSVSDALDIIDRLATGDLILFQPPATLPNPFDPEARP